MIFVNNDIKDGFSPAIRGATDEQLWSGIDRYLSSEEPANRWRRLYKLTAKNWLSNDKTFDQLLPAEKDKCFLMTFGGKLEPAGVLMSILLALADTERFQPYAFQCWLKYFAGDLALNRLNDLSSTQPEKTRVAAICTLMTKLGYKDVFLGKAEEMFGWIFKLGFCGAEAVWLARSLVVPFCFDLLTAKGVWLKDKRISFVSKCMQDLILLEDAPLSDLIGRARALFQNRLGKQRQELDGSFLPRLALIVEGPTEELLFPYFANLLGVDFNACAITIIPAGGANQVLRRYGCLSKMLAIPIVVVLDKDASNQASEIAKILRDKDCLHVISDGEIEDVFEHRDFVHLVNEHLRSYRLASPIESFELSQQESRIKQLTRLWRERGLGDFDKIGFAKTILNKTSVTIQVPHELRKIVSSIERLAANSVVDIGHGQVQ